MSKKCNNCKNHQNDPRWCRGCEHNFPGPEQFDFYQAIEHSVLMMKKDGPIQTKYEDIISCEHKDGLIVLTRSGGDTASFTDDGSWLMFDYTPTTGWNENPGIVPEICGIRQVKIQLVRRRDFEDSTWVDNLYMVMDAARFYADGKAHWEDPDAVKEELRKVIQGWLSTKQGWKANAETFFDFNWGDMVNVLPIEAQGVTLTDTSNERLAINAEVTVAVDQDERLAPDAVPAVLLRSDGTQFGTGTVNFRTGMIHSVTSDQVMPKFDEPILVRPEYSDEIGLIARWDAQELRYFLDK